MAKLQFMTLENLTEFKGLLDADTQSKIAKAISPAIKTVSQSSDKYTIFFYTKEAPVTEDDAAFSITLPAPVDISGKADKVTGATPGNFAGLDANGNLTDSGKNAASFDAAGAAASAKSELMAYIGTIPTDETIKTVVAYIQKLAQDAEYDDSAVRALISSNASAIGVLNGTGDGSVSKTVALAIADIVAGAPESLDTLKEIADWISGHASDAANMNSRITTNKGDIDNLKTLIGQLPEGTAAATIVDYIAEYVGKALKDSDLSQYAKAADLQDAVGRVAALETGILQTQAKVDQNAAAITGLQTMVGDGFEAIPSSAIKALFASK